MFSKLLLPFLSLLYFAKSQPITTDLCKTASFDSSKDIQLSQGPITVNGFIKDNQLCLRATCAAENAVWFSIGFTNQNKMVSSPPANVIYYQ